MQPLKFYHVSAIIWIIGVALTFTFDVLLNNNKNLKKLLNYFPKSGNIYNNIFDEEIVLWMLVMMI